MTGQDVVAKIQQLYGKYSPAQLGIVYRWFELYTGDLPEFVAEMLRSLSWREYRTPPGPKEFEDVVKEIARSRREAGRPELQEYKAFPIEDCMPIETTAGLMRDLFKKLTDRANVNKKETKSAENQKVL